MFSSVPKREYAVRNINLSLGHMPPISALPSSSLPIALSSSIAMDNDTNDDYGVILLVGRSASGKSTLLRLLAGMEHPIDGSVGINGQWLDDTNGNALGAGGTMPGIQSWAKMGVPPKPPSDISDEEFFRAQPVILQAKPEFDDSLSVSDRIFRVGLDTIQSCHKGWERAGEKKNTSQSKGDERTRNLLRILAGDFASLLTLSEEQCRSPPSELSPSGEYLFGIACGCMMSVVPSIAAAFRGDAIKNYDDTMIDNGSYDQIIMTDDDGMHYPILLLDELFDAEHSSIVEKCGEGMANLIRAGAVVISATHRPGYFDGIASRTITLSGGKILMDEKKALPARYR